MAQPIQFKEPKASVLEKFGIYYLKLFRQRKLSHHVFEFSDEALRSKVMRISVKGILLSAGIGLVCVWPTVYVDLLFQNKPPLIHYAWSYGVLAISFIIEFYILFLIALRSVHEVSELINTHAHEKDFLQAGPFNIINILSRAALQLPDPEMQILGKQPVDFGPALQIAYCNNQFRCPVPLEGNRGDFHCWCFDQLYRLTRRMFLECHGNFAGGQGGALKTFWVCTQQPYCR